MPGEGLTGVFLSLNLTEKSIWNSKKSLRNGRVCEVSGPILFPLEDIREMVRLASLAPSVNNYQPWSFVLITNKEHDEHPGGDHFR